jgi:hypothetical protein
MAVIKLGGLHSMHKKKNCQCRDNLVNVMTNLANAMISLTNSVTNLVNVVGLGSR